MKTVTVYFQAIYVQSVEVPDNWEPSHENIAHVVESAVGEADFQDGSAAWEARNVEVDDETYEVD